VKVGKRHPGTQVQVQVQVQVKFNGDCARAPRGADRRSGASRAARPGIARRRSRRLRPRRRSRRRRFCPSGAAEEALKSVTGAAEPVGAALRAEVGAITAAAIAAGSAFIAAAADAARPPPSPSRRCACHHCVRHIPSHAIPARKRACHSVRVLVCAYHHCVRVIPSHAIPARMPLGARVGVRAHARLSQEACTHAHGERERKERESDARERPARSAREASTQHCRATSSTASDDRAGHARHEGPVLPSRDVNRTQLRADL
jgi:hypothetical protein